MKARGLPYIPRWYRVYYNRMAYFIIPACPACFFLLTSNGLIAIIGLFGYVLVDGMVSRHAKRNIPFGIEFFDDPKY